jgi:serine protease AprX
MDLAVLHSLEGQKAGRVSVIVRMDPASVNSNERAFARLGGYVYRHLGIVNSEAVNLPAKNLKTLIALQGVTHVSGDVTVAKDDMYTLDSSEAGYAWVYYNAFGQGVGVAIVDSGIAPSADFGSRVVAGVNFSPDATSATDLCGHGTHVAGIVAGNGANSNYSGCFNIYLGVAPYANLVNVRVLNSAGTGSVSQVISGIQWAVANKSAYNIKVLNLSIGHPVGESYRLDPLCQACEAAWNSGIVVVCAAGNQGRLNATPQAGLANGGYGIKYGSIDSPGNDPKVITVGAMKRVDANRADDTIATYSSRGPTRLDLIAKPDIVAAGNQIVSVLANNSTLYQEYASTNAIPWQDYANDAPPSGTPATGYLRLSGTSMATPVVSGAVAQMLSVQPNLSPDTVKGRLMLSATKWVDSTTGYGNVATYGAGYLNIYAAMQSTFQAGLFSPATSPSMMRNLNGYVYLVGSQGLLGGLLGYQGGANVYGSFALWGEQSLWSTNSGPLYTDFALWGESGVWTDTSTSTQSVASAGVSPVNLGGE